MPPLLHSRHTFTAALKLPDGRRYLTARAPFRYRDLPDNRTHVVVEGDTLQTVAARYFADMTRPAGLWWVVADFQPDPVFDPTIRLGVGRVLVIPSLRTVIDLIFAEGRRTDPGAS